MENPTDIDIVGDNKDLSDLSLYGDDLKGITPDILCIPCKNKRKIIPDTSIIRKQPIQEPVNPSKRAIQDTITYVEKSSPKETPPQFWNKVDYEGYTNEKTHGYDDSPSETDDRVINLDKNMKMKRMNNSNKILLR